PPSEHLVDGDAEDLRGEVVEGDVQPHRLRVDDADVRVQELLERAADADGEVRRRALDHSPSGRAGVGAHGDGAGRGAVAVDAEACVAPDGAGVAAAHLGDRDRLEPVAGEAPGAHARISSGRIVSPPRPQPPPVIQVRSPSATISAQCSSRSTSIRPSSVKDKGSREWTARVRSYSVDSHMNRIQPSPAGTTKGDSVGPPTVPLSAER